MLLEILNKNYDGIWLQIMIIFMTWVIVILAIGIDLFFGIQKSKSAKIYMHSFGLRQTSGKVVQYLAFMFFMVFVDVLNPVWVYTKFVPLPLFSIFGAIVLVYTEFKSVREKSSDKFRLAVTKNPLEIIKFITDNRDLIDGIRKMADSSPNPDVPYYGSTDNQQFPNHNNQE